MEENPYRAPCEMKQRQLPRYVRWLSACLWITAYWLWVFFFFMVGLILWFGWPLMQLR